MSMPKSSRPVRGQLHARGTTYLTGLEAEPILAYGASELRITGFQRNVRGNHAVKPRYNRVAVRADNPEDAAWTEGTAVTDDTPFAQDFSLASLGSFLFVVPALGNAATSGGAGEALAYMQAFTDTTAEIVARQRVVLGPWINTSQNGIVPLGNLFPAFGVSGVMVAIAARGISGSPKLDIVTRTYTGDPSIPSSWDTTGLIGTDKTFSSTNEDYNTGNLAFAPDNVGFAQLGAWLPEANANGTLDFIVAVKY